MGKTATALVVLLVGLVIGYGVMPVSEDTNPPPPRLITVLGTASVSTAPDEATVSLGVRKEADTNDAAVQLNADAMSLVMKALAGAGIEESDISTTDFNLDRHYENRDTKRETVTYVAENEVQVTIRDLTKVGTTIDAAVSAGATSVGNVDFKLSNANKVRQQALLQAVKSAQAKAAAIAEASGLKVGDVVSLREQVGEYSRYGYDVKAQNWGTPTLAGLAATPVAPEQVQTEVDVTAVFELQR